MQFVRIDHKLVQDKNLISTEKNVLSYLLLKFNEKLNCAFPSMKTIAENTNVSLATVKRAIKKLSKLGYLTIEKRKGIAGNYNIYKNLKYLITNKVKKNKTEEANYAIAEDMNVEEITKEETEMVKQQINNIKKHNKTDNHTNVRLARGVTNIDKSNFAKIVLTMAKEELVREAIKNFKAKKGKSATFLIKLLVDEYYKANIGFSTRMFNLLKAGLKDPCLVNLN